jgi:hypothetical protein
MDQNTSTQIKATEQLVLKGGMDANEHEALSNITLRNKLGQRNRLWQEMIWM